ncbi:MAG: TonB-dependent receptor [Gammaproteobacteria bacterium]|nr:TonB-dependent receptor [Gammaproteobacteria bacterium]MBT8150876.1 TonB-dependent receptor [Gammaproteobacteria bacterium]NND38398.1 TonB-dependent receptor [Pseudomonadales bacterium]NNM11201.1 TonB-dependent receptor [Pseudomonadales bacterium]
MILSSGIQADDAQLAPFFDEITIIGSAEAQAGTSGSAHFIDEEALAAFAYSDVQQVLRAVPGVSIQLEDGYGLRPNIGIRGVPTDRSARVVLLEDNVPIAPAPYSASSAYYFPTMGRMYNVEVVKGPASLTQGPNTIGGAINFVSTPIPAMQKGSTRLEAGSDSTSRSHFTYGKTNDSGFGWLLETHQWKSAGFQNIDRSSNDTGLDIEDYTAKLAYAPVDSRHGFELKLQYAQQDSNQSYLGLSDADFDRDAYRRYGVSALDNITTEHVQQTLRYEFTLNDQARLSATAYNNEHKRSWFKTEKLGDGTDYFKWFTVIQNLNNGNGTGTLSASDVQNILDGADSAVGAIELRDNNREYYSRGLQTRLDIEFGTGGAEHALEFGVRYHRDEEDRLQQDFRYTQQGGTLQLASELALGDAGNRVQQAKAVAVHLLDTIQLGALELTPGLRYENIELQRTRYNNGAARTFRDQRKNSIEVWLPGVGASYLIDNGLSLVAGVHKGFSSPGNDPDVQEEDSVNYELGMRYLQASLSLELMGFFNDYDNILGVCSASTGSNCDPGDTSNGGKATVQGLELQLSKEFALGSGMYVPLSLVYTYSDSEFDSSFSDSNFFGDVTRGDPIPYIAENQASIKFGLAADDWQFETAITYVDEVCARPACDEFEITDATTTVDAVQHFQLSDSIGMYLRVENLLDAVDIVARQPYGARPNKARTAMVGFQADF